VLSQPLNVTRRDRQPAGSGPALIPISDLWSTPVGPEAVPFAYLWALKSTGGTGRAHEGPVGVPSSTMTLWSYITLDGRGRPRRAKPRGEGYRKEANR
jgi:hypothetical protein